MDPEEARDGTIRGPFAIGGRKKPRSLGLQEVRSRLDELELIGSMIRKLDVQSERIAGDDPGDETGR